MLADNSAYLEIILGPMFSGKTTRLLEIYKKASFCNKRIMVINYSHDKRYSDTQLSTHDLKMIPCTQTLNLNDLYNIHTNVDNAEVLKHDVILINEGQFFDDLLEWVSFLVNTHSIHIYVCGLDSDFKKNKFGQIIDLIPLADNIVKLTAWCVSCKNGTPAIYSHRISSEKEQCIIGSSNYIPVCRNCYNSLNKCK